VDTVFGEAGSATSSDRAFSVAGGFLSAASGGPSAAAGGANAVGGTSVAIVPLTALAPHAVALAPPAGCDTSAGIEERRTYFVLLNPTLRPFCCTEYKDIPLPAFYKQWEVLLLGATKETERGV
jgi:hypothetical protein